MSAKKTDELRQRLGDPSKKAVATKTRRNAQRVQAGRTPGLTYSNGLPEDPPAELDSHAARAYKSIVSQAEWLTTSDLAAVTLVCQMKARVDLVMDSTYDEPFNQRELNMIKAYMALLGQLGLDPRNRVNLGLAVAETGSKLDAFRKNHGQ